MGPSSYRKGAGVVKSKSERIWIIIGLALLVVLIIAGQIVKPEKEVVFASFDYSETVLLGEIVKRLLEEKTDIRVEHLPNMELGVAVAATQIGEVDAYLTYSGTQFTTVLKQEVTEEWIDPQKVLEYVEREVGEKHDMLLMDPLGFDNTYAVAVRREFAEEHDLHQVSDLGPYAPDMVMATDADFLHREEVMSYTNMTRVYDMSFEKAVAMNYGLMYQAVQKGDVDAIVAYSSDGRISAMDLKILEDDKSFFPPYDAMLIIRNQTIAEHPELYNLLDQLSGRIDQETIQRLNARADVDGDDFADIAEEFLEEQGLI
jgi:glycine betaine/choline ABC-type transport system substrate-binding protein